MRKKKFNLGPHPHVFSLTLLLSIPLCERATTTPLWISFTAAPFWRTLIAANPLVPPQLLCFNQIPCNPSISVLWNPPATVGIFTGLQVLMRKKTRLRHWIPLRRGACMRLPMFRGLHKWGFWRQGCVVLLFLQFQFSPSFLGCSLIVLVCVK